MFRLFHRDRIEEERDDNGRKVYSPIAISPEAYRRIEARSMKTGDSLIDTVDKIMGVRR